MSWFLMACSFKRSQRDRLLFCDVQFHFLFGHTWLSIFTWIIFDSRCPFLTHLTCGDLFTHPSNPPNLGGENEPTWFVLVQNWKNSDWLWMELWIWAHWISPPTNQAKDEKENRWFWQPPVIFSFMLWCVWFFMLWCFWFFSSEFQLTFSAALHDVWVLMVARVNLPFTLSFMFGVGGWFGDLSFSSVGLHYCALLCN